MDRPPVVRLVDYIAVLELEQSEHSREAVGTITKRFPENDWDDLPFSCSLQMFCVPQGWDVTTERQDPTFFVCTLTDIMGGHQYACCLQFQDLCTVSPSMTDVEDGTLSEVLYKPKVFVLLSRHAYFDLFRACLNRIYSSLSDQVGVSEQMIATLVSGVQLQGRVPISFSLSNERLSVRPLQQPSVPITTDRVAALVKQLGTIHNLLLLIRSLICDQKIVLVSASRARLSDSAYALKSLLYPFEYSYTYVPVLPELLLEYLESPTPFIMGVSSLSMDKTNHLDAVIVNLDIGSVRVPDNAKIAPIPEPFYSRLVSNLQMVLCPELITADCAMAPALPPPPSIEMMDKYVRVCILRFFCEILYGYRTSLELVRLHHQPLIVFHKAAFLGMRCLSTHSLLHQLLDSQMFQLFVASRGIPYRPCDIFDDLVCSIVDVIASEETGRRSSMENIEVIAKLIYNNEHQEMAFSHTPVLNRKLSMLKNGKTSDDRPIKLHELDSEIVNKIIGKNIAYYDGLTSESVQLKEVPAPMKLRFSEEHLAANGRRLDVLTACMNAIFDNKLSEARKMLCAVELSLRAISARLALCQKLSAVLDPIHRGTLPPQQFELVVRLINCALDQESEEDEHGVAYACLYLSHVYCRRLGSGVHQFAYTCIQDHAVWSNQRFWEAAFFHDVHQLIRRQYMDVAERKDNNVDSQNYLFSTKSTFDMWNLLEEPTAMQIAAARLQKLDSFTTDELNRWNNEEESIVYGQAKHYINLMVYLRVPLDPSRLRRINRNELEARGNGRSTRDTIMEEDECSQSSDVESGYIENVNDGDWGSVVVKWISRLIDRICSAAGVDQKLTERLNQDIPGFVAVHIDNLEQVYYESKRLTPVAKSELPRPVLFTPSEHMLTTNGLRSFLLPDSRALDSCETPVTENITNLLPAEGAVFITNYRIVFKGTPCNPFLNDQVVIRSIPIMALTKDKTISDQQLQSSGQLGGIPAKIASGLHDAIQFRSAGFQLMKIAFDEEVTAEQIEDFSKTISARRWPQSLPHTLFAYSSSAHLLSAAVAVGTKTKYSTIRDFKKTIIKFPMKGSLARRLGGSENQQPRAVGCSLPPKPIMYNQDNSLLRTASNDYLDLTEVPNNVIVNPKTQPDVHREFLKDYERMKFGSENSISRLSYANSAYEIAKTYPSVVVVPSNVADDAFPKIAKGFKHGRFPVITWANEHGAMIIRGAGFNANSAVVQKFKKQSKELMALKDEGAQKLTTLMGQTDPIGPSNIHGSRNSLASKESTSSGPHHHSTELQEMYITRLAQASPSTSGKGLLSSNSMTSLLSVDSVMSNDGISVATNTPDLARRAQTSATEFTRNAANFVRNSGGKAGRTLLPPMAITSQSIMEQTKRQTLQTPPSGYDQPISSHDTSLVVRFELRNIQRKNMYILGEKNHSKALRLDKSIEFVPITYPTTHQVKVSFKKFMRVMCPSWGVTELQNSFHKLLEDSEWMLQISSLLSLSASISNLIDLHNASVSVCIEDGWDATAQLTSLSQIILDPFYRTFVGFKLLVEKEWLAFGHRFSHRANHTIGSQSSGIAPMFLMFLDTVHQLHRQFPTCFEFNTYYLRFIAYHSQAAFFRTFLLDCEFDRVRIEQAAPDTSHGQMSSVWNYIAARCDKTTLFHNMLYNSESRVVLRPGCSVAALEVWEFYAEDFLSHGSAYDIELAETELHQREEERLARGDSVSGRIRAGTVTDAQRTCTQLTTEDQFTNLLDKYVNMCPPLEGESPAEDWQRVMEQVYAKDLSSDCESLLDESDWESQVQRVMCKKSAVKLLVRGIGHNTNNQIRGSTTLSRNHQFESISVSGPINCKVCSMPLPGNVVKTGVRCRLCKTAVHNNCVNSISWQCGGEVKDTNEICAENTMQSNSASSETKTLTMGVKSPAPLHQGILMKKGATFKLWKPRWFVLDANNHKLLYFDSENDLLLRGHIDLCDVQSVDVSTNNGSIKKGVLELHTSKRNYALLADSQRDAELWKERIESVLKD